MDGGKENLKREEKGMEKEKGRGREEGREEQRGGSKKQCCKLEMKNSLRAAQLYPKVSI